MCIGVKINTTLLSDRLHCLGSVLGKCDKKLCYKKTAQVAIVHTNKQASQDTLMSSVQSLNPLNPELNPICYLLALAAHHFLHVSRIRVKLLTLRLLMSYIYIWSAYS